MTKKIDISSQALLAAVKAEAPLVENKPEEQFGFRYTLTRVAVAGDVIGLAVEFKAVNPPAALALFRSAQGAGNIEIKVSADGPSASSLQGHGRFDLDGVGRFVPDSAIRKAADFIVGMALQDLVKDFKGPDTGSGGLEAA